MQKKKYIHSCYQRAKIKLAIIRTTRVEWYWMSFQKLCLYWSEMYSPKAAMNIRCVFDFELN